MSVTLGVASVASIFLSSWFRVAAYGLCMVPMYALGQYQFEHLIEQLVKLKAKLMRRPRSEKTLEKVVV